MRKWLLVFFTALVVYTVFAASGVLVVGTTDKIKILDPAKCYDYFSSNILQNVMVGLVNYKLGTAELVPELATRWETPDGGKTYYFYIREDARFSNGDPITAREIAWSINRAMKLNGDPAFLLTQVIEKAEAVDTYKLKIVLKEPDVTFISRLGYTVGYPVNPKEYPEDEFFNEAPKMSASGPYMIEEWIRDQKIVLVENPYWYGPKPKVKKVVIVFYEDPATLRLALENGEIDVAYRHLDPRDFLDMKAQGFVKTYEGDSPQIRYIVFNVTKKPFDNVLVRRAIAYAVDRQKIVNRVFVGLARPLYSMIPMGMWSHEDAYPKRDLEKAKELLKKAGYSETDPLKIDLWYTPTHYGGTESDVAQVLKESLEETGMIEATIKYAEWSTYIDYFLNGTMGMFLLGWYPDYIDPDDYTAPFVSTEGGRSLGSFYSDPVMDKLLEYARRFGDVDVRTAFYDVIQEKMTKDVPYLPLWQGVATAAAQPNVKGILLEPTQIFRYYIIEK